MMLGDNPNKVAGAAVPTLNTSGDWFATVRLRLNDLVVYYSA